MKKMNAFSPDKALSAEQIGIIPLSMWDRMSKMRDYRPKALMQLIQVQIVNRTPDGKLYINQEKLNQSRFKSI